MKRFMIIISIILLLFILTPSAIATNKIYEHKCTIELVNVTDKIQTFWLSWIDHPFLHQTQGKPWMVTVAEIKPKKSFIPSNKYSAGLYTVKCREAWKTNATHTTRDFTILPETRKITILITTVMPMEIPLILLNYTPKRHIKSR